MPIDRIPMDERRRWLIKIVMLIRYTFRGYFGLKFANKWGFYVDRHMSRKVHEFLDWIDYINQGRILKRHMDAVYATVVSNDGYLLFTGDFGGAMKVWYTPNDWMVLKWQAHEKTVKSLAFQSGLLVSGSEDNSIKIWDTLRDYQLIHTLEGHTHWVMSVDINEKATQVISGSRDSSIRIWSVKTGECIRVLMGHLDCVRSLQFIGDVILSGDTDKSLKVWNPSDGTEIQSVNEGIDGNVYDLSINCDASLIACVFNGGFSIHTWPGLKLVRKVEGRPSCCAFHPINPTVLAVGDPHEYSIYIFDLSNYHVIRSLKGHISHITDICFTPDGFSLVSVSEDTTVRNWDVSFI